MIKPFVSIVIISLFSMQAFGLPVVLDEIAAIVDDDLITITEVKERVKTIRAQAANPEALPPTNVLTEQILERLIVESLQLQMARRAGFGSAMPSSIMQWQESPIRINSL